MKDEMIIRTMQEGFDSINKRLDTLNGSVAKHADKLAGHDIINAQMTLTHQQITDTLAEIKNTTLPEMNKTLKSHDDFIISFRASLNTFKWLFGFVGIGNLIMFLKVVINAF